MKKCGKALGISVVIFISQILSGTTSSFPDARRYVSMPVIFHLDDFDRCMLYGQDEALYCTIEVRLLPENPEKTSEIWQIIEEYSSDSGNYRHDLLRHGLCIPDTFPNVSASDALNNPTLFLQDRLVNYYNEKYKLAEIRSEIVKMHCQTQESQYPIDLYDVLVGTFLVVYVAFVIFASFYEVISRGYGVRQVENSRTSFISAFSIPKNWRRLVTVNWDNPDSQNMRCIQGVRFYNMVLVIAAHTLFGNFTFTISNYLYLEKIPQHLSFPLFANGGYAVQTYFMISTWLLTYYFFMKFENAKEIKLKFFLMAFIHRYLRLIPTLAVVVAFYSTWMVRLSRGPQWEMLVGDAYRDCRRTWWANLLFINGYIGDDDGRMCMPETWYVRNDMLYFVVTLFLLRIMRKNQKRMPIILAGLLAVHFGVIFNLVYTNNWDFLVRPTPERLYGMKLLQTVQWHATMNSIWANIPGFVAGIAFGYIHYNNRAVRLFDSPFRTALWWVFIWGSALGIIMIPGSILLSPHYEYNPLHAAILAGTGRIVFVLGIGVCILGMIQGTGKLMKMVCEWEPLYILGRLTYSAYLTNVFIMRVLIGSKRSPTYLSDLIMFADVMWYTVLTYGLALVLTLLIEMPVSELLKSLAPNVDNKKRIGSKIPEEKSVRTESCKQ